MLSRWCQRLFSSSPVQQVPSAGARPWERSIPTLDRPFPSLRQRSKLQTEQLASRQKQQQENERLEAEKYRQKPLGSLSEQRAFWGRTITFATPLQNLVVPVKEGETATRVDTRRLVMWHKSSQIWDVRLDAALRKDYRALRRGPVHLRRPERVLLSRIHGNIRKRIHERRLYMAKIIAGSQGY